MTEKQHRERRNFSSFDTKAAMLELGLTDLQEWDLQPSPLALSDFFRERQKRLKGFDLTSNESAKELLIDAVFEEILTYHDSLKIWKGAHLQSTTLTGAADYLVAPRRRYVSTPLVCVAEAKRDDFEQGLAQCLMEMKVCREQNARDGIAVDIYGIVTNGEGWKFYRLKLDGEVWESALFSTLRMSEVLGAVNYIFAACSNSISDAHKHH